MRVHDVGSVGARPPMLAESQLAFLRDPDLVGDAVFVGGAQGGTLYVARGVSVGLEIAEADRRKETQCRPVCVVSASGVCAIGIEFGAAPAAPIIHVEASCSCTLQRSTMSHRRRQILAGHHWGAESEQLGHDAHAVRRTRHAHAGRRRRPVAVPGLCRRQRLLDSPAPKFARGRKTRTPAISRPPRLQTAASTLPLMRFLGETIRGDFRGCSPRAACAKARSLRRTSNAERKQARRTNCVTPPPFRVRQSYYAPSRHVRATRRTPRTGSAAGLQMPFGPSPHTPGAELVRGKSRSDPKESAEHGRRKPSHRAVVRPLPEDGHAPPSRDGHAPRRRPASRRAPSPTCLLCIMIVLLTLAKLLPSVLHSHPAPGAAGGSRQTDRPIASVAATPKPNARSPEVTAPPPAAAVRSADAPTAVPAAPERAEQQLPALGSAELPVGRSSAEQLRAESNAGKPRGGKLSCISFQAELCPPLNLSLQTPAQQSQTHARCAPLVRAEQTHLAPGAGFCGAPS